MGSGDQMILYNGASGGLGRHLGSAAAGSGSRAVALTSRLEAPRDLARELEGVPDAAGATYVHLAARVSVSACEADPVGAMRINATLARAAAAEAVAWAKRNRVRLRIILVSTGHVYAAPRPGHRLVETDGTDPRSAYARSKLQAEIELFEMCAEAEVPLLIARVFGLVGPDQPDHYILPGLIRRIREWDLQDVPGLRFSRDYLDARDVCRHLVQLTSVEWHEPSTTVNVCSGEAITIRDLLQLVADVAKPELAPTIEQEVTEAPGRAGDIAWLVGSPDRLVGLAGGPPRSIPLVQTVRDALAAHRGPR